MTAHTQVPSCSIATQVLKSPVKTNIMSASHHNVTCAAGEWEASITFSMIASKVREGIFRWYFMAPTFAG